MFETIIRNKSSKVYDLYENGQPFERVNPAGSWIRIVSESPLTTYSRWQSVTIEKDGSVTLELRPGWVEPDRGPLVTEFLNNSEPVLWKIINGASVALPRGIPVISAVALDERWAYCRRVEWRQVSFRRSSEQFPGYFDRATEVREVNTLRSEAEINTILDQVAAKGIEPAPMPEAQAQAQDCDLVCEFENRRDSAVTVYHEDGRAMLHLEPGASHRLECTSARSMYSRFSKITFKDGEVIETKENGKWKNPFGSNGRDHWWVELYNIDSPATQIIWLNGETVKAYRGIPRVAEVSIRDREIFFKKIEWKKVKVRVENKAFPGYSTMEERLEMVCTKRNEREIERVSDQLKTLFADYSRQKDKDREHMLTKHYGDEFSKKLFGDPVKK